MPVPTLREALGCRPEELPLCPPLRVPFPLSLPGRWAEVALAAGPCPGSRQLLPKGHPGSWEGPGHTAPFLPPGGPATLHCSQAGPERPPITLACNSRHRMRPCLSSVQSHP